MIRQIRANTCIQINVECAHSDRIASEVPIGEGQELADARQAVAEARAALGEEAWAAYEDGQSLSLEAAVAEALNEVDGGERSTA